MVGVLCSSSIYTTPLPFRERNTLVLPCTPYTTTNHTMHVATAQGQPARRGVSATTLSYLILSSITHHVPTSHAALTRPRILLYKLVVLVHPDP
jgi:hypothetical protein